jgi:hypothetical protein
VSDARDAWVGLAQAFVAQGVFALCFGLHDHANAFSLCLIFIYIEVPFHHEP